MDDPDARRRLAAQQSLGARLRRARGRMSLERLADRIGMSSRAALARYEAGEVLLPVRVAEALDRHHRTGGAIARERDRIAGGDFAVSDADLARGRWVHHFPATYCGEVWTRITPTPAQVGSAHVLRLAWGPWRRTVLLDGVPPAGTVLAYTKGDDGLSIPLFARIGPAATMTFGLGGREGIDINPGWTREH